jgi:hypothetical protein
MMMFLSSLRSGKFNLRKTLKTHPIFPAPGKSDPHIRVPTAFISSNGPNYVKNQPRYKGPWRPLREVLFGRILANGAQFNRIFHTLPIGRFYGVFRMPDDVRYGKQSPIWAYFCPY